MLGVVGGSADSVSEDASPVLGGSAGGGGVGSDDSILSLGFGVVDDG